MASNEVAQRNPEPWFPGHRSAPRITDPELFAMLTALGGCETQLAGHVAGNLTIGTSCLR